MSSHPKIAIITSQFNREITQLLQQGTIQRLQEKGIFISDQNIFSVPGAIEIPVIAATLASKETYDAIVCLGAVIRGETSHYDYVCLQVSYGCQKIAIEQKIPIIFGILTTENDQQALDRCGGIHGHKGVECADAALDMIELMRSI
jgi:6,7-dimethyl-8-ribityllumazine synthase